MGYIMRAGKKRTKACLHFKALIKDIIRISVKQRTLIEDSRTKGRSMDQ